ncbi:MAG: histidinol-phosphatase [Pseudomonadota bacterium]
MEIAPELQDELWEIAGQLADAAAQQSLPYFRSSGLSADNKSAGAYDPVTEADRKAEEAMRSILADRRPQDGILGEEWGLKPGESGLTWVLDPIDGTRAFLSGAPTWGTLIAVDAGDGPVLGVIDQPFIGERFVGGFGRAEVQHGVTTSRLKTRACARLGDATLFTTYPEVGTDAERSGFEAVRDNARLTRYSLDCYAFALLALGSADLVIEAGLQTYDIQGPQAVVEAAGGIVTSWSGGPAHQGGQIVAAGDPRVHEAALEVLSRFV